MADGDDTLAGGLPLEAALHPAGSGRSRWAQQELGELLGPSWTEEPAAEAPGAPSWADDPAPDPANGPSWAEEPAPPAASGALWEVERMPSEAEGGVVGLLLGGRRDKDPVAEPADSLPPMALNAPSGMARLTELLDHLPQDAVARVTPDDVDVAAPSPAPPAVWFWGDDDIYPGKVPGVVEARPARPGPKRRFRHSA
ncbi:MAG TPA: hypothetical protein VMU14_15470 [Acidimicrobiales bacterium]|nr:hypothetical protein [Acidimicrobiales bacterium]